MKHEKKDRFLKQPTYPGGMPGLKKFIVEALRYPESALQNKIEGVVSLRFDIDHKGNVSNVQLLTSIGHGCDEEAIRLILLLKFITYNTQGLRVVFHKNLNIHFMLAQAQVVDIQQPIVPEPQVLANQPTQVTYIVKPKVAASTPKTDKPVSNSYKIIYTIK
jgi:TonB family protein